MIQPANRACPYCGESLWTEVGVTLPVESLERRRLRGWCRCRDRQRIGWFEVVTSYPCPACGVGPGEPCLTVSGNAKREPHADRSRAADANRWRFAENDPGGP